MVDVYHKLPYAAETMTHVRDESLPEQRIVTFSK